MLAFYILPTPYGASMKTEQELRDPATIADCADVLVHEAQHALDRMDTTLTLTEANGVYTGS